MAFEVISSTTLSMNMLKYLNSTLSVKSENQPKSLFLNRHSPSPVLYYRHGCSLWIGDINDNGGVFHSFSEPMYRFYHKNVPRCTWKDQFSALLEAKNYKKIHVVSSRQIRKNHHKGASCVGMSSCDHIKKNEGIGKECYKHCDLATVSRLHY